MNVLRVMHSQDWGFKGIKDAFWDLQSSIQDLCRNRPAVVVRPQGSFSYRTARTRTILPQRERAVLHEKRSVSGNRPVTPRDRIHSVVQKVADHKKRRVDHEEEEDSKRKKSKPNHRDGKENHRK